MGVPKFYRWLAQRYPLINRHIGPTPACSTFDSLYLDMNGIIHTCSHDNSTANTNISFNEICENVFSKLNAIVETARPTQTIYIGIDGSAPIAKMNQQRSRRFQAAKEAYDLVEDEFPHYTKSEILQTFRKNFDSNCITPGTVFMSRFDTALREFLSQKRNDLIWSRCDVILSGQNVPGEGEHKIMDHIRQAPKDQHHLIHSMDADLVMLSLSTMNTQVSLIREPVNFPVMANRDLAEPRRTMSYKGMSNWEILDMGVLKEYFKREFSGVSLERVQSDLVVLLMWLGNDFLPHFRAFGIMGGGLNRLFEDYAKYLKDGGEHVTSENGVNFKVLAQLVRELNIKDYDYKLTPEEDVEAAKEYIRGIQWCWEYYFKGLASWDWFYPFHYPPTKHALISVLESEIDESVLSFSKGNPLPPIDTLAYCLPPYSSNLLPEPYQDVMRNELVQYYPTVVDVDMDGVSFRKPWEGIPLTPFLTQNLFTKAISEAKTMLSPSEKRRNGFGEDVVYPRVEATSAPAKDTEYDWEGRVGRVSLEDIRVFLFTNRSFDNTAVLKISDSEARYEKGDVVELMFPVNDTRKFTVVGEYEGDRRELLARKLVGSGDVGDPCGMDWKSCSALYMIQCGRQEFVVPSSFLKPASFTKDILPLPKSGDKAISLSSGDITEFSADTWMVRSNTSEILRKFEPASFETNKQLKGVPLDQVPGIPEKVVKQLISNAFVRIPRSLRSSILPASISDLPSMNIGLSLHRFDYSCPHYCFVSSDSSPDSKQTKREVTLTQKGVSLLKDYLRLFPEVLTSLTEALPSNVTEMSRSGLLKAERISALKVYLNRHRADATPLVHEDSEYMTEAGLEKLAEELPTMFEYADAVGAADASEHVLFTESQAKLGSLALPLSDAEVGDVVRIAKSAVDLLEFGTLGVVSAVYKIPRYDVFEVTYKTSEGIKSSRLLDGEFVNLTKQASDPDYAQQLIDLCA